MIVTPHDIYYSSVDPWYYIKNFLCTFDEHDQGVDVDRKPFPNWEEVFLPFLQEAKTLLDRARTAGKCEVLIIPKSRQLMVSWIAIGGFSLWCMMNFPYTYVLIQSKLQEDSRYQLKRTKHLYETQPEEFKDHTELARKPMSRQHQNFLILENGSKAEAVASGGDIVRSRVPTIFISDESAFQADFEESFNAGLACSQLIIAISSPNAGHFQRLVEDTDGESIEGVDNMSPYPGAGDGNDESGNARDETHAKPGGVQPRVLSPTGWRLAR